MGYFIFDPEQNSLISDEIHHIKDVMRLKPGSEILATDGKGQEYRLQLKNLKPFEVKVMDVNTLPEGGTKIKFIISSIKVPLLELIIQKLTEIGVDEIIITKTKFSQITLDKLSPKLKRWETIIQTACKQSERAYFPKISIQAMEEIDYEEGSLNLIGDTQYNPAPLLIKDINISEFKNISLLIGPEGGFEKSEYESLINTYNYKAVKFAANILRTETAAIVGAGILKSYIL